MRGTSSPRPHSLTLAHLPVKMDVPDTYTGDWSDTQCATPEREYDSRYAILPITKRR